jgi:hypothetical protein
LLAVRTLVDPGKPGDLAEAHRLQDAIRVEQPGGPGKLDLPHWDPVSQKKVREALVALADTLPDTNHAFGPRGQVDPVRHLIAAASAWGGNPDKDARYLNVVPPGNDGKTSYRLTLKDVPVDGFWSISLYDAKGYFEKNALGAYTVNNLTAKPAADGGVTVQFGGCTAAIANCLPIMPGWNFMVRLYRPRPEALTGAWKLPALEAVK